MVALSGRRIWWVGGALAAAALLAAAVLPLADWTDVLEDSLEERNLPTAMLVFCAVAIAGTLLLLPASIFPLVAGAAFGPLWGFGVSLLSATLASLSAYLLARHALTARVERAAQRNKSFAAVDKAVKREPWKIVALLRLSPVLPSGLKSYFLGLTCVEPLPYTLASAAGLLPGIALKVYLGHLGRDALQAGGSLRWIALGIGITATAIVTWIVSRAVQRRLGL
jgi:uncharacterized membrane protein YdjX (TVP38/TMEM64 family)